MCTMCLTLLAELITFAWILQTQRPKQEIIDQLPVFFFRYIINFMDSFDLGLV